MNPWLILILSLPTENATVRMRAWRTLKASGAAVLRDGVYLLPARESSNAVLKSVADDVQTAGGVAHLLRVDAAEGAGYAALFDRSDDYALVLDEIGKAREALSTHNAFETLKQVRKLRKGFANLSEIDFFPGEAQKQTDALLRALETYANGVLSADEPQAIDGAIPRLLIADYQGRTWATRKRPWVDRLASAWLIRRFIDPDARFVWLVSPAECPDDALGFDFDGAAFSHVDVKVTFEVLQASFGLEQPALKRVGAIVHYLDAGGLQPTEANGVERVLAGLREAILDDDQLFLTASAVFEGLLVAFEKEAVEKEIPKMKASAS